MRIMTPSTTCLLGCIGVYLFLDMLKEATGQHVSAQHTTESCCSGVLEASGPCTIENRPCQVDSAQQTQGIPARCTRYARRLSM